MKRFSCLDDFRVLQEMRDTALTMLREKLESSVLNEDVLMMENIFFVLKSEMYQDSHCLDSAVRER